jgi:hypothetical protein
VPTGVGNQIEESIYTFINICLAFPTADTNMTQRHTSVDDEAEFLATHWMGVKELEEAGEY